MELKTLKQYLRVDYDDDDDLLKLMRSAALDEMKELIPNFDADNLTNRQKILLCAFVKELYDNRDSIVKTKESSAYTSEKMRYVVRSLLLNEMLG